MTTDMVSPAAPRAPPAANALSLVPPTQETTQRNTSVKSTPPVDQDGAFLQDKVLKSGWLHKRTRKTKSWKRRWFVLRVDRLSCYKDQKEYQIHRQIYLADVTAVAILRDAKRPNVFGVFCQDKNFHFRASSEREADNWVEKIRGAAAVDVTEEEMMLSPTSPPVTSPFPHSDDARLGTSYSEAPASPPSHHGGHGRVSVQTLDYSGPDVGSVSSLDDMARISQLSLSHHDPAVVSGSENQEPRRSGELPRVQRNPSGHSSIDQLPRVIWHGYLHCLKSKGGVKQEEVLGSGEKY